MAEVKILTASEQGLVVEFGNSIDPVNNQRVHSLSRLLRGRNLDGVIEVVPTYRSLMVYFEPFRISRGQLQDIIYALIEEMTTLDAGVTKSRVIHIPVCYGGEFGPDLGYVASHNGLTEEEVISIHSSKPYLVYMLGFTPGFPYLGGMSDRIATPRLEKPRTVIPAGSVGIAGSQTGFYPIESPGGWRLIGRTPIKAFNPDSSTPFMFDAGDYLQFKPVSLEEYIQIRQAVEAGSYVPEVCDFCDEGGKMQ